VGTLSVALLRILHERLDLLKLVIIIFLEVVKLERLLIHKSTFSLVANGLLVHDVEVHINRLLCFLRMGQFLEPLDTLDLLRRYQEHVDE
jgi:hypothetical protein